MTEHADVTKWKKRLNRQGPFYLLRTEPYHKEYPRMDGGVTVHDGFTYTVIWNDGHLYKTKLGTLRDHMMCRYGIQTETVLKGERPHDLWNGSNLSDEDFQAMLDVRHRVSTLPKFSLDTLEHLNW